jgi:hypothetical protein
MQAHLCRAILLHAWLLLLLLLLLLLGSLLHSAFNPTPAPDIRLGRSGESLDSRLRS